MSVQRQFTRHGENRTPKSVLPKKSSYNRRIISVEKISQTHELIYHATKGYRVRRR